MTATLTSRGPGLGVYSTAPLEVCCPHCGKHALHALAGMKDRAVLNVWAVARKPDEYTPEIVERIRRPSGLTAAQTGVQLPAKLTGTTKLPADKIPF